MQVLKRIWYKMDLKRRRMKRWKALVLTFGLTASCIFVLWEATSLRSPHAHSHGINTQFEASVIHAGKFDDPGKIIHSETHEDEEFADVNFEHGNQNKEVRTNIGKVEKNIPETNFKSEQNAEDVRERTDDENNEIEKVGNVGEERVDLGDEVKEEDGEQPRRKVASIMENIKKSINGREPLKLGGNDHTSQSEHEEEEEEEEEGPKLDVEGDNAREEDVERVDGDGGEDTNNAKESDETGDEAKDSKERAGDGETGGDENNNVRDDTEVENDRKDAHDEDGDDEILANMKGIVAVDENDNIPNDVWKPKQKRERFANFFSDQPVSFSDVTLIKDEELGIEDGIPIQPFITACYGFLPMIDFFGSTFSKAKSDLQKNILKIQTCYDKDHESFTNLQRLLAAEFDVRESDQVATKGVRWIKRSMEFTKELLKNIEAGMEVSQAANEAYEVTLIHHHNWIIQKIFKVGFATLGSRNDLLRQMAKNPDDVDNPEFEKVLAEDMDQYLDDLQKTLDIIKGFFDRHNIEN